MLAGIRVFSQKTAAQHLPRPWLDHFQVIRFHGSVLFSLGDGGGNGCIARTLLQPGAVPLCRQAHGQAAEQSDG